MTSSRAGAGMWVNVEHVGNVGGCWAVELCPVASDGDSSQPAAPALFHLRPAEKGSKSMEPPSWKPGSVGTGHAEHAEGLPISRGGRGHPDHWRRETDPGSLVLWSAVRGKLTA